MRTTCVRAGVTLVVAALSATPAAAQSPRCDGGRGAILPDLGFDRLPRVSRPASGGAGPAFHFAAEPRITGVRADGPAAGKLRDGDVLVALDGAPITSPEAAARYAQLAPERAVRLAVRRAGALHEVPVAVAGRCVPFPPPPPEPPAPPVPPNPSGELMPAARLGFDLTCEDCGREGGQGFRFRRPPVVRAVEPNSDAARAGLRVGDAIVRVDGVALTGDAGWSTLAGVTAGRDVRLVYRRADVEREIAVRAAPRHGDGGGAGSGGHVRDW